MTLIGFIFGWILIIAFCWGINRLTKMCKLLTETNKKLDNISAQLENLPKIPAPPKIS